MNGTAEIGVFALCLLGLNSSVGAADFEVSNAWIRPLAGGASTGGYFTLLNNSDHGVELIGASSSDYRKVMLHDTKQDGGQPRMVAVEKVPLPAKGSVKFSPGGYHLMLTGPVRPVSVGDRISVTLELSDKHRITVQFHVRGPESR